MIRHDAPWDVGQDAIGHRRYPGLASLLPLARPALSRRKARRQETMAIATHEREAPHSIMARLSEIIGALGSVAVAFSGGADSTLLLAVSIRVLGADRVLAVTADSATLPRRELEEVRALATELGARLRVVQSHELDDRHFAANTPQRCYYCKSELFRRMRAVATEEGLQTLIYGATADDQGDFRPGMDAARQAGAVAPLLLAGLTKDDVRTLSRHLGLRTWDKPSMACLSSRLPYGTPITREALDRIERAEDLLRREGGFRQVRVRDHLPVARIELGDDDLERALREPLRGRIASGLKALGYTYVAVDIEGFRSGSMNAVLPWPEEKRNAPGAAGPERDR